MARSLDGWYRLINEIYIDRNYYRSLDSLFCHLVEVSAGLSLAVTKKKTAPAVVHGFLPKALGWWLAVCGRAGIPSVEQMVWAKFPNACPYCRLNPHNGNECKQKRPDRRTIEWKELNRLSKTKETLDAKPKLLSDWQRMFGQIYVRDENTSHATNVTKLNEELGELAEAVRTISIAPQYFVGEASDVFAWLMGFANQFDYERDSGFAEYGLALEAAMEAEYPGKCKTCDWIVCKCPPIPTQTLGRMAKDAPIELIFEGAQRARPLFTVQETGSLFGKVEMNLQIGSKTVPVDPVATAALARDIRSILEKMHEQTNLLTPNFMRLSTAIGKLEVLAQQGAVNSAAISEISEILKAMPPEGRSATIGFLGSLTASAVFQTILDVAKALPS